MEVLGAILFGLLLIGWLLYGLAQLLTPVGLILLIALIVLIWYSVARHKSCERERHREEEEKQAKAKEHRESRAARERSARELKEDEMEFGGLADRFAVLLSSAGEMAEEVGRASYIIKGEEVPEISATDAVFADISQILAAVAEANGNVSIRVVRLGHAVLHKVAHERCANRHETKTAIELFRVGHNSVSLPFFVGILANCDISQGTNWSPVAATLYRDLVLTACEHFRSSIALRTVADQYVKLLSPYVQREDTASPSARSIRPCEECRQYYARLGIPPKATRDTIRQRYRDLCNVWHPDRFEHNERLKDKATKEFQEMQRAFQHIDSHFAATV
jgi:uncharacterized membrane protein